MWFLLIQSPSTAMANAAPFSKGDMALPQIIKLQKPYIGRFLSKTWENSSFLAYTKYAFLSINHLPSSLD